MKRLWIVAALGCIVAAGCDGGGGTITLACQSGGDTDGSVSALSCAATTGLPSGTTCPTGTMVSECPSANRVGRCTITNGSQMSTLFFYSPTTEEDARTQCAMTSGSTFTPG